MSVSWYYIRILLESDNTEVFKGYFSVNDTTNLLTGFYEITGTTNETNILVSTSSGTLTSSNYLGFKKYTYDLFTYDNIL